MPKDKSVNLIHLGTRIQTVFAILDGNGNVAQSFPINLEAGRCDAAAFAEAAASIHEQRVKLKEQLAKVTPIGADKKPQKTGEPIQ